MLELIQLAAAGAGLVGVGAFIISHVRQRWLVAAILLWLLGPLILMASIFSLGALLSPPSGSGLYALVFVVMLIGTFALVPWLLIAGIGVAIGLALRRKRAPETPVLPTEPATPSPAETQTSSIATPHFSQLSPDGSIRIDIEPVEWTSSQWVHTPRVTETGSDRILLDLLGSDWEANTSFPRDRYVWLGLRRYRSPGFLFVDFDLDSDRYRIALGSLDEPDEEGLLGDISGQLEPWWAKATARAAAAAGIEVPAPAPAPGPFAAWPTALAILVGAIIAIAGLTYLSITYGIDPPHVPTMAHIPRMPG